jgi:DNA sulfur modification protein DndD
MILRSLTLSNFGTYAGSQTVWLEPNAKQSVILIGGKNGTGKSTFLEAIRLCLYGPQASRNTLAREKYERYLLDRIHRDSSTSVPSVSASIEIDFDYADHEGTKTYRASRRWQRTANGGVQEAFELFSGGNPVSDVDSAHWQDFIQELMPIGVSDLFFFDGEKVQLLAEDESDSKTLSEAVRNLLGTDIIEKLNADLAIYRSKAVSKDEIEARTASELKRLNDEVQSLKMDRDTAEGEAIAATSNATAAVLMVQELERQLQEQGGAYARNRGRLEERKKQLSARLSVLEETIREHSQGLLPVSLAPKVLRSLLKQLDLEQDVRVGVIVDQTLSDVSKATLAQLRRVTVKRGTKQVPLSALPEFSTIASVIKKTHQPKLWHDHPVVHDLSNKQEQQVRSWAVAALDSIPSTLKTIGEELETLYREQQKVERDLSRIPSDEILIPLTQGLTEARARATDANLLAAQKRTELANLIQSQADVEAAYAKQIDAIASRNSQRSSLERAATIQAVLAEFKNALVVKKIKDVEFEVTRCFNLLSRKMIDRSIEINPLTFEVTIRDNHSRLIDKSELSAGEKQIYAISVLWALARVSGRPLPMIIDTPLARLDRDHRALLAEQYFPHASHQVIILSTDSEIDAQFVPMLGNSITRTYELKFDSESQSTRVEEGYFAEVLHRAIH